MKVSEAQAICKHFVPARNKDGKVVCTSLLPGDMCRHPDHFDCDLVRAKSFKDRKKAGKKHWSVSACQRWEQCQRLWALRYIYKIEPPERPMWSIMGTAFGTARAKIDLGQPWEVSSDVVDEYDRARVRAILRAYENLPRTCAHAEERVVIPIDDDTDIIGYIDGSSKNGGTIYEWKYAAGADYYDLLTVGLQTSIYLAGKPEANSVVIAVAKKATQIHPKKATPEDKRKTYVKKGKHKHPDTGEMIEHEAGACHAGVILEDETPGEFEGRLYGMIMSDHSKWFVFKTFNRDSLDVDGMVEHLMTRYEEVRAVRAVYDTAIDRASSDEEKIEQPNRVFLPTFGSCRHMSGCDHIGLCSTHLHDGLGCDNENCSHPSVCDTIRSIDGLSPAPRAGDEI